MKHWMKLALPVGLGIAAGIMHYQVLAPKLTPATFAQLTTDLEQGDVIKDDHFRSIQLSGELARKAGQLTRWEHRSCHFGRLASRRLRRGDVVFLDDSIDPNNWGITESEEAVVVRLDNEIALSGRLRVGAALKFKIYEQAEEDFQQASKTVMTKRGGAWVSSTVDESALEFEALGPARILAVQGDTLFEGPPSTEQCRQVTIAVPKDPDTNKIVPWAARLLAAVNGKSEEVVSSAVVCQPPKQNSTGPSRNDVAMNR